MKSRFHEAAEADLAEDCRYYEDAFSGLGDQFIAEVRAAVQYLEQFPRGAPELSGEIRGKTLVRFPHTLLFVVDGNEVVILAVAHQRQDFHRWLQVVRGRRPGG